TDSALTMSVVGVLQTVPVLLFGPLVGVYLDHLPKKPTMIAVSLVHGALVALIPLLHSMDRLSLHGLYGLVFAIAVVASFYGPALTTAIPLIVGPGQLASANALIQGTGMIGVLVGPVAAGIGISLLGMTNILYVDALSFAIF